MLSGVQDRKKPYVCQGNMETRSGQTHLNSNKKRNAPSLRCAEIKCIHLGDPIKTEDRNKTFELLFLIC